MSEPKTIAHPYDSAFKTLVHESTELMIPLVNAVFGTTFRGDEKIVLHDTEQLSAPDGDIESREVDSCVTIDGYRRMAVHFECQSTPDDMMVVRFWEYDSHIAMRGAAITPDGVMEIRFPHSAVLYLRHTESTPDTLKIRLRRDDETTIDLHEIPVVKTQRYTIDEMFKQRLYFLIPFYPFAHEKRFNDYETDETKRAAFLDELEDVVERLRSEQQEHRIDDNGRSVVHTSLRTVLRGLSRKYANILEGVENTMKGEILDYEAKRIRNLGRAEGKAEGRAEGELDTYIGLVRDHIVEPSVAAARLHISEGEFRAKLDSASL